MELDKIGMRIALLSVMKRRDEETEIERREKKESGSLMTQESV